MAEQMTPMMRQYLEIKKANPDAILFFRLGDFYEMFDDDARVASKELDLTLTTRDHGKHAKPLEEQRPMCGVPYHASDAYIARLIAKGYKVAICEQMEDPATAKGLVKRDIIRVVTPGTITDAASLDDRAGNFLCAIFLEETDPRDQEAPPPPPPEEEPDDGSLFAMNRTADGSPADSIIDSTADSLADSTTDGTTDSAADGTAVSTSDGTTDSTADNTTDSTTGGTADGTEDSTTDRTADRQTGRARRSSRRPARPQEPWYAAGAAFCDLSTGEVHVTSLDGRDCLEHLMNEIVRFTPAEVVLNETAAAHDRIPAVLREKFHCRVETGPGRFLPGTAAVNLRRQFGQEAAGRLEKKRTAALAVGGLLHYLYETQKGDLSHINQVEYYQQTLFMEMDLTARRNLELTETLRGKERRGSLLWVLDRTRTPMGARRLRNWLERPLLNVAAIRRRNSAVEAMTKNTIAREELSAALRGMGDMERLMGRVVVGTAGGRDMVSLRSAMERIPDVSRQVMEFDNRYLRAMSEQMDPLTDLAEKIASVIGDEPPVSVRDGGFIRDGWNEEVDRLRHILRDGKGVLTEMEAREKEATGIRSLKIRYNKVFGYYIEVSNSFKDQVPDTWVRKQTLANGERFITPELKDLEHSILTADQRVKELEFQIFSQLREELAEAAPRIQRSAAAVSMADALCSLATAAVENRYCRPEVDESGTIEIHGGRHPVVERMLKDSLFVPNDAFMGKREQRVAIITGPNMAGKSTYMRQIALIVLMAQIGSFVPADSARIGIVDRIFTRIGASDDLSAGQSTFMVEMTEVADMLRCATKRSLLLLDEIGRGTSTYDGMSIARAVLEYCADRRVLGARTLFATHYHELTALEQSLPGTVNYSIAVKTRGEDIIFLRKILRGGADRSYGIEVARLAGLPPAVLRRAKAILKELEAEGQAGRQSGGQAGRRASGGGTVSETGTETGTETETETGASSGTEAAETGNRSTEAGTGRAGERPRTAAQDDPGGQVSLTNLAEAEVLDALRRCHPETMTPMEALGLLHTWKTKIMI